MDICLLTVENLGMLPYWTCIGLQCLSTAVLAALGVLSTEEVMECEQHSKARKANNIADLTWSRYVVTRYGMEAWVLFCKLSGSFYLMPFISL